MAKFSAILDQVDAGTVLLPEFQRGYVWNRDQVRGLMRSLYKGYPVGSLLVWETDAAHQAVRGVAPASGTRSLLLDGQQRVTTLYGVVRGTPPAFFEGDPQAFRNLRFNVETEAFEFYGSVKMKDDPLWADVTALFAAGPAAVVSGLQDHPRFFDFVDRLLRVRNVLDREVHVESITGADKTVDVVVDIFNRVNSGGTKLSRGDLALARICSDWPHARPAMRAQLDRWRAQRGLQFTPDWLLRNVNAVATGRAPFSALEDVSAGEFRDALGKAVHNVDHLVDLIASTLGLDYDRVLMGRYALPVLGRLLLKNNGRFTDAAEAGRALYWYVHAAVRGRFAGSTETHLAKDLETIDRDGIDGVIHSLRRAHNGSLTIDAQDFEGAGRGSRSYPLLYLVARTGGARDLVTGRPFGTDTAAVEVCEIFPRTLLAKAGYSRAEINAVANYAFVTPSSAVALTGDPTQLPGGRGSRRSGLAVDPGRRLAGGELPRVPRRPTGAPGRRGQRVPRRPVRARAAATAGAGHARPHGRLGVRRPRRAGGRARRGGHPHGPRLPDPRRRGARSRDGRGARRRPGVLGRRAPGRSGRSRGAGAGSRRSGPAAVRRARLRGLRERRRVAGLRPTPRRDGIRRPRRIRRRRRPKAPSEPGRHFQAASA